jgi:demethylmenaquinone methyltransferase/2-methoxy-6-polyprenyl-1,4-benzoquinol methylase|tara:strand:- start:17429 stop:18139 length:711 start_codon:yes stop_codon:yes gene_type:complete
MIKPYNTSENKKKEIKKMFNNIAKSYDTLNRILSLGIDIWWRKKAVKQLNNPKKILDIATGTADFAISAAKNTNASIIGIDISDNMLEIGEKKIKKLNLEHRIILKLGDAEETNFQENSFDAITIGFGVRNFENLDLGLKEMYRILKKNGKVAILEPSIPTLFPFKQIYNLYFQFLLPKIGGWFSKDKSAYSYLPNSVKSFPPKKEFLKKLKEIGFKKQKHISLSLGIVSLYVAIK